MKKRTAKGEAKPCKRISRPLLDKMLNDLAGRLKRLQDETEAFATLIKPNGEYTLIEHQSRTACGVFFGVLRHCIRDARELARLLAHDGA